MIKRACLYSGDINEIDAKFILSDDYISKREYCNKIPDIGIFYNDLKNNIDGATMLLIYCAFRYTKRELRKQADTSAIIKYCKSHNIHLIFLYQNYNKDWIQMYEWYPKYRNVIC